MKNFLRLPKINGLSPPMGVCGGGLCVVGLWQKQTNFIKCSSIHIYQPHELQYHMMPLHCLQHQYSTVTESRFLAWLHPPAPPSCVPVWFGFPLAAWLPPPACSGSCAGLSCDISAISFFSSWRIRFVFSSFLATFKSRADFLISLYWPMHHIEICPQYFRVRHPSRINDISSPTSNPEK